MISGSRPAEKRTHDGLTVRQQIEACRSVIETFQLRQARIWSDEIEPQLRENEIKILKWHELNHEQRGRMDTWFHEMVFPILTPLAVDPGHPFPFISNLSLSIGVLMSEPGKRNEAVRPSQDSRWLVELDASS